MEMATTEELAAIYGRMGKTAAAVNAEFEANGQVSPETFKAAQDANAELERYIAEHS